MSYLDDPAWVTDRALDRVTRQGDEYLAISRDDYGARIATQDDGTVTLWWTDYVTQDCVEQYPTVPLALMRLAMIAECERQAWAAFFVYGEDDFTAEAAEFVRRHANSDVQPTPRRRWWHRIRKARP